MEVESRQGAFGKRHVPWAMAILAAAALFVSFRIDSKVFHYHDSELYIRAACNLADGRGSFSAPTVGVLNDIPFTEHPPLWIFLHSLWYRIFGQSTSSTNAFPATVLLLCAVVTGLAALRFFRDGRAFFWAILAYVVHPTTSRWQLEALLDWGLAMGCALILLLLVCFHRRAGLLAGFLFGIPFALGLLAKGVFAFVFLGVSIHALAHAPRRRRAFMGLLLSLFLLLGFWFLVDGRDWTLTRSIVAQNVTPTLRLSVSHTILVLRDFLVRNAPWSLLGLVGLAIGWRRHVVMRSAALIVLLSLLGFTIGGKVSPYYWLMLGPALAFLVAAALIWAPPKLEAGSRYCFMGLFALFLLLRPFVHMERPSNRVPTERQFLSMVHEALGEPSTVGYFDCAGLSNWYIVTYGWNHFDLDLRFVCLDGDEAAKYRKKLRQYILPCSVDNEPSYLITRTESWMGREAQGSILLSHGGLSLVRRSEPDASGAPPTPEGKAQEPVGAK